MIWVISLKSCDFVRLAWRLILSVDVRCNKVEEVEEAPTSSLTGVELDSPGGTVVGCCLHMALKPRHLLEGAPAEDAADTVWRLAFSAQSTSPCLK